MIAGPESGVGKTTLVLGLTAAFQRRGLSVEAFKVGPDFLDPSYHAMASGRPCRNLDGWLLSREYILRAVRTAQAAVILVEGVMGLFDGVDGTTEAGSTAQVAKWLDLPVVLVVDVRAAVRSAAATVLGFEAFDPALRLAGVVFNRVGGPTHLEWLREAVRGRCRSRVLGALPWDENLAIAERHLGLVPAAERRLTPEFLDRLAARVEEGVSVEALSELAGEVPSERAWEAPPPGVGRCRIGVAEDPAFCFYYDDNLTLLRRAGAELVRFSPLEDAHLPEGMDGLYLGGGYPELHADRLAANRSLREEIWRFARSGGPIYAECGGFMYLCEAIRDLKGRTHPMVGVFPARADMLQQGLRIGYAEVRVTRPCPLGPAGLRARGHEFHLSRVSEMPDAVPRVYDVRPAWGGAGQPEGYLLGQTLGSYVHLHFGSNPEVADHFVGRCAAGRSPRESGG